MQDILASEPSKVKTIGKGLIFEFESQLKIL